MEIELVENKDRKKACPDCKKVVPWFSGDCRDCGYDFENQGKKMCPRCKITMNNWAKDCPKCNWVFCAPD